MTPESQRIAIAEAHGFTNNENDCSRWHISYAPDYLNDLNAMHEAEKVLTEEQLHDYGKHLGAITTVMTWWDSRISGYGMAKFAHATAAQRAEAFLKALGLWVEEPVSAATVEGLR